MSEARTPLTRFEWACVALLGLAFALRVSFVAQASFIWDSAWYLLLARSFAEHGSFLIPWTDPPQYSGYWPPLYPILLSPFVKLFGPSYPLLVAFAVLVHAALVAAVFVATRQMMGRARAFAAAAAVASSPAFLGSDQLGMTESFVALWVALAVWAFLRSLERPAWLAAAAVFGALAYLSKANLGVPILAALVVVFLAWRVWTKGPRAFVRSPVEMGVVLAGLLALALLAWTRSGRLGGVGLGVIAPLAAAVREPLFVPVLLFKIFFAAAFLLAVALPFSLRAPAAARGWRDERAGALWLATLLPLVAGALFTASFYFYEDRALVDFDNIRYLTPSFVPFLWLLLPHWPLEEGAARGEVVERGPRGKHLAAWGAAVAGFALLLFLNPVAGPGSKRRLFAFVMLSLVALLFARVGMAFWYRASVRSGKKVETRYEAAKAPSGLGGLALSVVLAGAALAWFFSAWYLAVAGGAAIALATPSPRARAAAMLLFLLASTAPAYFTNAPEAEAASALAATVPPGSIVALTEPAVYFAAVAPSGYTYRTVGPDGAPPDAAAILAAGRTADDAFPNFTVARSWDYRFDFTAPLAARLALEEALGTKPDVESAPAIKLFVRSKP